MELTVDSMLYCRNTVHTRSNLLRASYVDLGTAPHTFSVWGSGQLPVGLEQFRGIFKILGIRMKHWVSSSRRT